MKPHILVIDPAGQRILRLEAEVRSVETLQYLIGAGVGEQLDAVVLRDIGDAELVLIRRSITESMNEALAYSVSGVRVSGKAIVAARPKGAPAIETYLTSDPAIGFAPISIDEALAAIEWTAPVARELKGQRDIDVQELDAYAKEFCERAFNACHGRGVIRLHAFDMGGAPAAQLNVACDWRDFRRVALDLCDRRFSVLHEWVVREKPYPLGGNEETRPLAELAEFKLKEGGHQIEMMDAEARGAFGIIHPEPIVGSKLAKRSHRLVAIPGLMLFLEDGVPVWPSMAAV